MKAFTAILGWLALAQYALCNVLIVHDPSNEDVQVDSLTQLLKESGHEVKVLDVKKVDAITSHGRKTYDNIVVIPGKTKGLGRSLTSNAMLDFLKLGGNIVALTTPNFSPASLREMGAQLGISVSPRGNQLIDNFSNANGFELAQDSFDTPEILPYSADDKLVLQAPAGAVIDSQRNELSFPLIHAQTTTYVCNPKQEAAEPGLSKVFAAGKDVLLAAAFQGRNDARFVWVGDSALLAGFYGANILSWAFHDRDSLRVKGAYHRDPRTNESHHVYRINDPIEYCIDVEERSGPNWTPYVANDLQLEFIMLDPYYRLNLEPSTEVPGRYCRTFDLPDQYGMFTFSFSYLRKGKTYLSDKRVVTIRHNANDEWPRSWSITNSWVYITSIGSVVVAWLAFVALYLGSPSTSVVAKSEAKSKAESETKSETKPESKKE